MGNELGRKAFPFTYRTLNITSGGDDDDDDKQE
jgi:hypothetical protein